MKKNKLVSIILVGAMFISGSGLIASTNTIHKNKEVKNINLLVEQGSWNNANGTWYYNIGDQHATGWQQVNGTWYYFASSGAMATGWQKINDTWYYFVNSGAMSTGWQQVNGTWYYFAGSGAMETGWQQINGSWYYMQNSGAMQTGWGEINGTWYHFDNSGAMQVGWNYINGTWYYFVNYGAMATGWQEVNGTWYYFASSGAMNTGWNEIYGQWYYFAGSGAMQTGWLHLNGQTYYLNESGAMLTGEHKIDGTEYTFNSSGQVVSQKVDMIAPNKGVEYGSVNSSSGLWLVSNPSMNPNKKYYVMAQNSTFKILGQTKDHKWYYVDYKGTKGWCYAEFVTTHAKETSNVGKAAYVNSTVGLWLKEKPSLTSARLSLVPYQTQVRVIATNGDWSEANVNGQVGWLYTEYLTFTSNKVKK